MGLILALFCEVSYELVPVKRFEQRTIPGIEEELNKSLFMFSRASPTVLVNPGNRNEAQRCSHRRQPGFRGGTVLLSDHFISHDLSAPAKCFIFGCSSTLSDFTEMV